MDSIIYSPSGAISLHISEDKMSAWISVQKSDRIVDEQEILDLIDHSGICYGLEDALAWMAENGIDKDFNKPFPVAICKPSSSEQILNFQFDKVRTYKSGQAWTFEELKDWTFVEQSAVLADMSYNLFTDGGSIYNIFGELTANPANSIDLSVHLGANVGLDNDKIVAVATGYPYLDKDNKICVMDSLEFDGDVCNIDFPITLAASLVVKGSIANAHINIMKNLTVTGDIKKAEIYAGGNLTVQGNISECQTSGVIVLQDLKVKSIFDSLVVCKGRLFFDNLISGSRIIAEQQIWGNFEISNILGSKIQTSGSIDVASLGNADGIETELEITISPFTKERMTGLTKTLIKLKSSPDANAEKIEQIQNELHNMEIQLSDELSVYLKTDNTASRYIKAHQEIYRGVYLRILKRSVTIKQYQTGAEFFEE